MRASTIMLCLVIAAALYVGVTVGLHVKRSLENVGHRLDCAVASAEGKVVDAKGRSCAVAKVAAD